MRAGQPVIILDTKKKELVGQYRNDGKELRPKGEPEQVKVFDFVDEKLGKENPYDVYDMKKKRMATILSYIRMLQNGSILKH